MTGVEVCHVEAGLRSYDMEMPEEVNRRLSDHVSDHHFVPTEESCDNLLAENIPARNITVTGNTIVDAVKRNVHIARKDSDVLDELSIDGSFALLTAHRAENVDDQQRFISLLEGVAEAARKHEIPVVYPIHPRAEERISEFELKIPQEIQVVESLDFLDFLALEEGAEIVFTDSGGVQEETCILRTPCVTLRDNTERPETVDVGANVIVGVGSDDVVEGADVMINKNKDWENPFGDGTAAERILDTLEFKGE
jgi:UDP-N-acetylglucosamine 2-epimerase (non-hydrolysing)